MSIAASIISFLVMLVITFILYIFNKKYIFNNVVINKWIPLSIAIALTIVQILIGTTNRYISMTFSIFTIIFFLWFMDIMQTGGPKKKINKIVIRPKAKPNRVKKNK